MKLTNKQAAAICDQLPLAFSHYYKYTFTFLSNKELLSDLVDLEKLGINRELGNKTVFVLAKMGGCGDDIYRSNVDTDFIHKYMYYNEKDDSLDPNFNLVQIKCETEVLFEYKSVFRYY